MRIQRAFGASCLLVGLFATGCLHTEPDSAAVSGIVPYYRSDAGFRDMRRVIILPLDIEDCADGMAETFSASLARELTRRGMFEVIPVNANDLADIELTKTRSTGIFTTDDLVRISHRFGADGALHGVVSHGAAAPTLRIGVRASLIDCRSGQVAWASDVSLDTGSRRVASDARAYHNTVLSHSDSLLSADRMLVQPGLFLTYVAHRMAETLAASRAPNNP